MARSTHDVLATLRPPPGRERPPVFSRGWRWDDDDMPAPYLSYLGDARPAGWSAELEAMHVDSSLEHPIDVLTRATALAALRASRLGPRPALIDVGCSSGHLLADLQAAWPDAELVGVDAEGAGLPGAHARVAGAALLHASATDLPLGEAIVDGLVALNLLEHLGDDTAALREFARVLRPGARAVIVVPSNPRLYDYYDAHLKHERRYARGELADKSAAAGLRPVAAVSLGSVVYPAFWLVKTRNRRVPPTANEVGRRVQRDIERSAASPLARAAFRLEGALLRLGARPRWGIREALVLERPA